MIQSFADGTTADLWEERNSKAARRVPRELRPIVHRNLTMLDSAQRLEDLAAVSGNRLEALVGDRKGQHSIRVNQQYRITFPPHWTMSATGAWAASGTMAFAHP